MSWNSNDSTEQHEAPGRWTRPVSIISQTGAWGPGPPGGQGTASPPARPAPNHPATPPPRWPPPATRPAHSCGPAGTSVGHQHGSRRLPGPPPPTQTSAVTCSRRPVLVHPLAARLGPENAGRSQPLTAPLVTCGAGAWPRPASGGPRETPRDPEDCPPGTGAGASADSAAFQGRPGAGSAAGAPPAPGASPAGGLGKCPGAAATEGHPLGCLNSRGGFPQLWVLMSRIQGAAGLCSLEVK